MTIKYPSAIDDSSNLITVIDSVTSVKGIIVNNLRDALLAVETELGIKPSGVFTTVRNRLDTIDLSLQSLSASLSSITTTSGNFIAGKDLSGTSVSQTVIALNGFALSSATPGTNQALVWSGAAWAPTTIISGASIQSAGTPLANNPHSTLNFTGAGITATDIGGIATINVPIQPPTGSVGGVLGGTLPNPTFATTTTWGNLKSGAQFTVLTTDATVTALGALAISDEKATTLDFIVKGKDRATGNAFSKQFHLDYSRHSGAAPVAATNTDIAANNIGSPTWPGVTLSFGSSSAGADTVMTVNVQGAAATNIDWILVPQSITVP